MKTIKNEMEKISSKVFEGNGQLFVLIMTVTLFLLSAVAPNATIGIGK